MFRVTRVVIVLMGVLALAIAASTVWADSATFTSAGANTLVQGAGFDSYNAGGYPSMFVGYWAAVEEEDGILRFDVSSLKDVSQLPNFQVNSVTLKLFSSEADSWGAHPDSPLVTEVHALSATNADWVAGSASLTPQTGASCWDDQKYNTLGWKDDSGNNNPGLQNGGYGPLLASQSFTAAPAVGTEVDYTFTGTSAELTSLITGWFTADAGLLMYSRPAGGHTAGSTERVDFYNTTVGAYSPQLVVGYAPEPGAMVLLASGLLGLLAYAWRKRR